MEEPLRPLRRQIGRCVLCVKNDAPSCRESFSLSDMSRRFIRRVTSSAPVRHNFGLVGVKL
jgi:hypothetical protein